MGYYNDGKRAPRSRWPGAAPGSVGSAALLPAAVQSPHIAAGAVGALAVAAESLTNVHIAVGANILGSKLLDFSVDSQQIAASAITGPKVAPGAIGNSHIAIGADIDAAKLLANSVGNTQLATTGLDVSRFTTGSLALARLGSGALAAGVTINNANWSGTALADANLASGITGSKVSGALPNATLAGSALTAGTVPATVKINNGNWSGTALALANLATGALPTAITVADANFSGVLTAAKLGSGYPTSSLSGTITSAQLEARLLQGFKSVQSVAAFKRAPNTAIPFATQSWGAAQWSTTSTISLGVATTMQLNARVSFGPDGTNTVDLGAKAQLYLVDSAGTVVAAGEWGFATTDESNNVVLVATLRWAGSLAAGATKTYQLKFRGFMSNGSAPVTWTLQAESLGATPYEGGSYIEGIVIP